jgi:hypothetical protein
MNDGSLEIECRIDPKLVDNPDNMGGWEAGFRTMNVQRIR